MNTPNQGTWVPCLPDNAPFSPEQRAYLNGFLAGLFSRTAATPTAPGTVPAAPPQLQPLTILYGSQTGNSENLARRLAKEAGKQGFAATIHSLEGYSSTQLASETHLLILTSTYGDGEPPDNARSFWQALSAPDAPRLGKTRFSLCALGDSSYAKFCGFGRELEARLVALGAQIAAPRRECDVDYEDPFLQWTQESLAALKSATLHVPAAVAAPEHDVLNGTPVTVAGSAATAPVVAASPAPGPAETVPSFGKKNPFPAPLLLNRRLTGPGSGKDVRHFEIALEGSGLAYEAGDALAVVPQNDPALVAELLAALGLPADAPVACDGRNDLALVEALTRCLEITRIPKALLEAVSERSGDATLKGLCDPGANGTLTAFLTGRDIVDLLRAHPQARFSAGEFVGFLRKLQPRLYSISSSPKAHPGQVHLTVGTVRYESLGRARAGVCSTFLADRVPTGGRVPVFVHSNKAFRPAAGDTPMIMVGPGTGIAPFRAFLEERRATGATGKNWLFFGDQKSASDFLYADEIVRYRDDGLLTRLDLAWSRDQSAKVYVQDRMKETSRELWEWLEVGAGFYVCGDASRMAKDVEVALLQIIGEQGNRSPDQATEYLAAMKKAGKYRRDVY